MQNKRLVIISAGAFGRETAWLAERINAISPTWDLLGFVDDGKECGALVDGYPVLGGIDWLQQQSEPIWAVCAIGTSRTRKRIWEKLKHCPNIRPATLVDPSVILGKGCEIGVGAIICAGSILAIGTKIGAHCILNLATVVGHDTVIGDCCTLHPRTDISGGVQVDDCCDIGAGCVIRDEVKIGKNTIIGMGSLVTKDIPDNVVAYGSPCQVVRENTDGIVFR